MHQILKFYSENPKPDIRTVCTKGLREQIEYRYLPGTVLVHFNTVFACAFVPLYNKDSAADLAFSGNRISGQPDTGTVHPLQSIFKKRFFSTDICFSSQ